MGAVKWNGAERTETDDGIIIKTHREFTGTSWDDLLEIPVDTCLQGSAFYNITAGKAAFWDGSENWVETDGTEHSGIPPVPEFWKGLEFFSTETENEYLNGAVFDFNSVSSDSIDINPSDGELLDVTSSDPEAFSVEIDSDTGYVWITPHVTKGTAAITYTFKGVPQYGKLTVTIGGANPYDLYWYNVNNVIIEGVYPESEIHLDSGSRMWIGAYETEQPEDAEASGALLIHGHTEGNLLSVTDESEGDEHYIEIEAAQGIGIGNAIVQVSVPSKDILTYFKVRVTDDGGGK